MALTFWIQGQQSKEGNLGPFSLYYEMDRQQVLGQKGATSAGLINIIFRKAPVTVFAAKDSEGNVLPLLALPCPPYYHELIGEALPGNILGEEADEGSG